MTLSSRDRRLRVGLVGLGWFGSIHLDVWRSMPEVKIAAICDSDPAALARINDVRPQDQFHQATNRSISPVAHLPFYQSLDEMLANEELDLLDIVVPEHQHYLAVQLALKSGVPVIVEKPLVTNLADARSLSDLAISSRSHIYVGNVLRFDSRQIALREMIDASEAKVRHLSFQRNFQTSALAIYGRVHPFFGACVHDIDLSIWFMGGPPQRAFAATQAWQAGPYPDVVVGILEWSSGTRAVIQNVWHVAQSCPYGFEFETKVFLEGTTGIARNQPDVEIWDEKAMRAPELHFWPSIAGVRSGALRAELSHFVQCAIAGIPSDRVPLSDAICGMACADALTRSADSGVWELVATPLMNDSSEAHEND